MGRAVKAAAIDAPVTPPRGRLFTTAEAAQYLGMPETRLRRLIRDRKVPFLKDGRIGLYERDLDEWMAAQVQPATGLEPVDLLADVRPDVPRGIERHLPKVRRFGG